MATWYVSTTGNDTSGDGSVGSPYRTPGKAESMASNGDTVNLGAGIHEAATYHTFAKQLAWVGAGLGVTLLRGNNATRVIYLNSTNVKTFTGITLDGLSSGTAPAYLIEGSGVDQATTFSEFSFTNGKTTSLRLNSGMKGVALRNGTIDAYTETQVLHILGGAAGFTLDNVTINVPAGLVMNAVINQTATVTSGTFSITNCPITVLSNYAPMRMTGGGFATPIITGNDIVVGTNNTRSIVDLKDFATTGTFSSNTITVPSVETATIPLSIQSTVGTGPDCVWAIEDNTIETRNADSYGILLGDEGGDINSKAGAFNGSAIRRNILRFAPYFSLPIGQAHGIMMGGNKNIYYEENELYGAAYGAACKGQGEAWTAGYIRKNKFINCTFPIRYKGQKNIRAANNVCVDSSGVNNQCMAISDNTTPGTESTGSFTRNNIYKISTGYAIETQDTSHVGMTSDYNCFHLTGTAKAALINAVEYATLADLQAAGYDAHSISVDPQLKADYTIDAASPCFEKGIPVEGLTDCEDTTENNLITLSGSATFNLDSPYKKRVLIS